MSSLPESSPQTYTRVLFLKTVLAFDLFFVTQTMTQYT